MSKKHAEYNNNNNVFPFKKVEITLQMPENRTLMHNVSFFYVSVTLYITYLSSLGKKCTSGATAVAADFTFTFLVSGNTFKVEKLIHYNS